MTFDSTFTVISDWWFYENIKYHKHYDIFVRVRGNLNREYIINFTNFFNVPWEEAIKAANPYYNNVCNTPENIIIYSFSADHFDDCLTKTEYAAKHKLTSLSMITGLQNLYNNKCIYKSYSPICENYLF